MVAVTGCSAALSADGSEGFYRFSLPSLSQTCTLQVTPPSGCELSALCRQQGPPALILAGRPQPPCRTGEPPEICNLGNGENGTTGFLTSRACTPFYLSFDVQPGDPFLIDNNIALDCDLAAPAPIVSPAGLALAVAALATVGMLRLRRP